jgi:hypothetical protein
VIFPEKRKNHRSTSGEDRPYDFGLEVEGVPLLDPPSLFIGKLHAWHHRADPEETSNDRPRLELPGEIIPEFLAEAKRRGADTRERCDALLHFLDRHATPLSEDSFALGGLDKNPDEPFTKKSHKSQPPRET